MKLNSLDKFKLYYQPLRLDRKVSSYIIKEHRISINTAHKFFAYVRQSKKRAVVYFSKKKNQRKGIYYSLSSLITLFLMLFIIVACDIANKNQLIKDTQTRNAVLVDDLYGLHTQLKLVQKLKVDTHDKLEAKKATEAVLKAKIHKLEKKLQAKAEALASVAVTPAYVAPVSAVQTAQPITYSAGNSYTFGFCTWFVKNMRPDIPNNWGDAISWLYNAQASGWATGSTPRVGAVGTQGNHVVYITGISGSQVILSEMNYVAWNVQSSRTASASSFMYIY